MGKNIKKNYLLNLFYQILVLITPLITAPHLSRVLGPEGVGKYSFSEATCSYFVMFATLGLTTFGQREISFVQQNRKERSIIFWETNLIELVSSLLCCVAYIIFSLNQSDYQYYLVLIFNILAVIANISWFFQGMEEFGKIVFRNVVFKILNIVFIFVFIREANDLIIYLLGSSLFLLANNLTYWIGITKYVDKPVFRELHPTKHLKTVFSLFVPTIAISIYTVVDKTMIGVITGDALENGYYELAIKISKMVLTLVTSLGTVMIPRIGFFWGQGNTNQVKSYIYKTYRFVWLLGVPLCIGLIMVADNFVPWFFGPGYEKVASLMEILALLIIAIGISNVTGIQYLVPTKRQNVLTATVIIGAIVNFLLNIVLIWKLKSYGAAIASVVAETVIAIVQLYCVRKELNFGIIIKSGHNYYIAGFVMGSVLYFCREKLSSTFLNTLLLILIGAVTYIAILFLCRDDFFISNLKNIYNKLRKKKTVR